MAQQNCSSTEGIFEQCYSNGIATYLVERVEGNFKANNILLATVNSLVALCGLFSNLFVILTYCRAWDPSVKRLSNMIVIALAHSDLAVCAVVQPLFILRLGYYEIYGLKNCVLFAILRLGINFGCGISGMMANLVTLERYIAIAKPYLYPTLVTRARLKAIIFFIWVTYLFIICSSLWFLQISVLTVIITIGTVTVIISTSLMWIHIFILTRRHKKTIRRQLAGAQIMKQYKETYSVAFIIILCMALFYTPILITAIYGSFNNTGFHFLYILLPWAETLVFCNSFANSAIFTWREKKFRHSFKTLIKFKRNSLAPASDCYELR